MKAKVKGKRSPVAVKKSNLSSDCGRMKYLGIDMAFIHVRGKRMLTMSEVARKLYPQWPRTTLTCRMRQMNIQRHLCTPREMQKVYSVNGIIKQGINCRLISKQDLDTFCHVYKVNEDSTVKEMDSETGAARRRTQPSTSKCGHDSHGHLKRKATSFSAQGRLEKSELAVSKQSQRDKNGTRVLVKRCKAGKVSVHKRHVAFGVNKAIAKQQHVVKSGRSHGVINGRLPNSSLTKNKPGVRKRTHSEITNGTISVNINRNATTKKRRKKRETTSPASDCASLDSGISSLALDTPSTPSKITWRKNKKVTRKVPLATQTKSQNKLKAKYTKMKPKKEKVKGSNAGNKSGTKRKSGKINSNKKSKLERGSKKLKTTQCKKNGSDTITKEFVIKMNLKHMNDKDLINSFSQVSSPSSTPENATPVEDPPYLVKLMPVKPVWRVNSSFKFISNFLLPPSLIVKDGDLKPACSMICQPGLRPPSVHPIWKWKIGEPVVGNKTEISYRMKKVKCIDSLNKKT